MTKYFIFLISVTIWMAGCGEAPKQKPAASSVRPVAVTTVTVATEKWPSLYQATGTVRARTSATISADLLRYHVSPKVLRLLQDARRTADADSRNWAASGVSAVPRIRYAPKVSR